MRSYGFVAIMSLVFSAYVFFTFAAKLFEIPTLKKNNCSSLPTLLAIKESCIFIAFFFDIPETLANFSGSFSITLKVYLPKRETIFFAVTGPTLSIDKER